MQLFRGRRRADSDIPVPGEGINQDVVVDRRGTARADEERMRRRLQINSRVVCAQLDAFRRSVVRRVLQANARADDVEPRLRIHTSDADVAGAHYHQIRRNRGRGRPGLLGPDDETIVLLTIWTDDRAQLAIAVSWKR